MATRILTDFYFNILVGTETKTSSFAETPADAAPAEAASTEE